MQKCVTTNLTIFRYMLDDGSVLISLCGRPFRLYEGTQPMALAYRHNNSRSRHPRGLSPEDTIQLIRLVREVEAFSARWSNDLEVRHALD